MSSSSPSSPSSSSSPSTRRPKGESNNSNGGGGNKNKVLRNENRVKLDNKDDNIQLVANPSYWTTNDNVKRSFISQQQQQQQQYDESPDVSSIRDYYADLAAPSIPADDITYFDDDEDDDAPPYYTSNNDVNAYFSRINQDNINDFYYEINKLLSRKPNNQKEV